MGIMDIIKEAFIFPSQNLGKLVIYILLTFVVGVFVFGGIVAGALGIRLNAAYLIFAALMLIIGIVVSLVISGYQVGVLKSGIDHAEEAPDFDWKNDLITGIMLLIVGIVYYIIPAIIVMIVAFITNLPGYIVNVAQQVAAVSTSASASGTNAFSAIPQSTIAGLGISIAITTMVAFFLFVIFSFLFTMGEARLANTGSLGEAVNIPEAFRDITRIGVGKVLGVVILVAIIILVIQIILGYLYGRVPALSILSVIVTPYTIFFSHRATGLLYSDIA